MKPSKILPILLLGAMIFTLSACSLQTRPADPEPELTMGQKLEGLLFWTQQEREERFPVMHELFPSDRAPRGPLAHVLPRGPKLVPDWQDSTTLNDYMEANHLAGVVVVHRGQLRLQQYAPGVDASTRWTSFSVAKSVTSLLLGAALQDGYVKSMGDRLDAYIPALADSAYAEVTVEQLLTMTSGVAWNEDYEDANSDVARMYLQPCAEDEAHIITYMKDLPRAHAPGTVWNYNTGETDLLGILVQQASGKTLPHYLSEKIWQPWGMAHDAFWLKDECDGSTIGGSGLSATLIDYARLGQFMLEGAHIDDEPMVSAGWLRNATRLLQPVGDAQRGYGYLWWINEDGSYNAGGIFGQLIHIDPVRQLVIVQNGTWPRADSEALNLERARFIQAINRVIDREGEVFLDRWSDETAEAPAP